MSLVIQDTVASSTFWLVAGLLFITLLVIFDEVVKTKEELKKIKASSDDIRATSNGNYKDLITLFSRVSKLENPPVVVVKPESPKVKKVKVESPISEIDSEISEED